MSTPGQLRLDAADWPTGRDQLNAILAKLQQGALTLRGLKLDIQLTAAPTGAPGAGDPNVVMVNVAGTVKLYVWTGAAWVVAGTQV